MIDQTLMELCAALTIKLCDQPKEYYERVASRMEIDRMKLLTKDLEKKLIVNYETNKPFNIKKDFFPVVKFFGGSNCTWLITEYDPEDELFFGLCDLGMGTPEMGYVSRKELESIKFKPFGLGVERDRHWEADKTLSQYAEMAQQKGRIEA